MKPKKILVASAPDVLLIIEQVYCGPEFSFKFFTGLNEAHAALDEDFGLIACGVHFNHGQFYDFLRLAKVHPRSGRTPFMVVLTGQESAFEYIFQSVEIASAALGAGMLIPISRWREEIGDERAIEKFRETIRNVILRAKDPMLLH